MFIADLFIIVQTGNISNLHHQVNGKQMVVHPYDGILLSSKEERAVGTGSTMDAARPQHTIRDSIYMNLQERQT